MEVFVLFLAVLSLHCSAKASSAVVPRLSCPGAGGVLIPKPGIEPTSSTLKSLFFTPGPPEKSPNIPFRSEESKAQRLVACLKVTQLIIGKAKAIAFEANPRAVPLCFFFPDVLFICMVHWIRKSIIHLHRGFYFLFFFHLFFISWRLITLQYCSVFCHTLTWISHGFTCVPHPDPPSYILPQPIPLGLPSAPAPSTCLMYPAWAGDLFHPW